jgi:hypothetical protein
MEKEQRLGRQREIFSSYYGRAKIGLSPLRTFESTNEYWGEDHYHAESAAYSKSQAREADTLTMNDGVKHTRFAIDRDFVNCGGIGPWCRSRYNLRRVRRPTLSQDFLRWAVC